MTDRLKIEKLLHELYASRLRGGLDGICATFTADAKFLDLWCGALQVRWRSRPMASTSFGRCS